VVDDGSSDDEGTGMVVVRRKGMTWQRLNQHYSIWEVAGHGAGLGNMLTLFPTPGNAVVVQSARALDSQFMQCSGSIPKCCASFLSFIINIKHNTVQLKNIPGGVQMESRWSPGGLTPDGSSGLHLEFM